MLGEPPPKFVPERTKVWRNGTRLAGKPNIEIGGRGELPFPTSPEDMAELSQQLRSVLFSKFCPPSVCGGRVVISDVPREAPGRPSGISARALASENRRAAKAARLARAEQMNTPQNVARASRAAARARANGRALMFLYRFLFFGETHRERAERAAGGSASEPSRATRTWRSGNPSRAAARARVSSFAPGHRSWLTRHITV